MAATELQKAPSFGIVHATLESVILSCDEVYAGFLGVSADELIGRRASEFTDEAGIGGPEMMISIVVRTGEPMSIRRTFVQPDGTRVACTFQLCLIRDANGSPHSIVAVGQLVSGSAG